MTKGRWKKEIIEQTKAVGMYKDAFLPAIQTLAEILEQRDRAMKQYVDSGSEVLIKKVSDRGSVNFVKNPLLQIWDDLNKSALAYWRDLGLTPAGLKRIDEKSMKTQKKNGLAEALKELGG